MDTQLLNDLIRVLEEESNIYGNILQISRNKTSIIVAGKVAELERLVKLEQSLILKMGGLEMSREQLLEKLSSQLEVKPSDITVSTLAERVDQGQAQKLKDSQDKMTGILLELKNTNELNAKLIKNSLEFINFSLNLLASADSPNNSYGNMGQTQDTKKRNLFDVKL